MLFQNTDGAYVSPDRLSQRELCLQYVNVYHDLRRALLELRFAVANNQGQPMSADAMRAWDRLSALADEIRRRGRAKAHKKVFD